MVAILERGPALRAAQIDGIEIQLGASLPSDYRNFLLQNNGGRPQPDVIDVSSLPGTPTDVQILFGVGRSVASSNLGWNLTVFAERCPEHRALPIGCDSGGNLFCLKVARGVASQVLYCDFANSGCTLYPVADSFDNFLAALRFFEN